MSIRQDLQIETSADFTATILSDVKSTTTTGWSAYLDIKRKRGDAAAWISLSDSDGIALSRSGGHISLGLTIDALDTEDLAIDEGWYDAIVQAPLGDIYRAAEGRVYVRRGCTTVG